ncbi:MAG: hypothetical protein E7223_06125 [Clostridiales bacterium]|nr:hypothetical protein [Clostridiales bacterium]
MSTSETQTTLSALLRRAELFLEDKEWRSAADYCQKALDLDPENSKAYVGLLLVSLQLSREEDLVRVPVPFHENKYMLKALRFASPEYKEILLSYLKENRQFRLQQSVNQAQAMLTAAQKPADILKVRELLQQISSQTDVSGLLSQCDEKETLLRQKATETAAGKKRKLWIILGVTAAIIILILSVITIQNQKRAAEIYQNFLGQTFSGDEEDDNGFYDDYRRGDLNPYMVYYLNTEERTLTFNSDGTVYYTYSYDMDVLAYPKGSSKPKEMHNEYDGTYDSFKVSVSLNGTVYVKIGSNKYRVWVDSNNVPDTIYDYHGIRLD